MVRLGTQEQTDIDTRRKNKDNQYIKMTKSLHIAKQYYFLKNGIMCSFDACSFFTNVPLDETIQICLDKLYALPDKIPLQYLVLF